MPDVELRELRLSLMLAEELHFGRTAERLGLTTSRVSQTVRTLERKVGDQRPFRRTSRVVELTEAGRALHAELVPAVAGLDRVLRTAAFRGSGPGVVHVGLLNAASGVDVLSRAIERFEATYAGATVQLSTTPFDDRLGPIRRRPWPSRAPDGGAIRRALPASRRGRHPAARPATLHMCASRTEGRHRPNRDALLDIIEELSTS